MEFAKEEDQQQLLHLFSIQPTDNNDKIKSVKAIFNTSGASEATKKAIQDFTFIAFETLEKMDIEAEKKAILRAFGENLMGRNV
jgi:geranylgeranyl diphosphate synthase type II